MNPIKEKQLTAGSKVGEVSEQENNKTKKSLNQGLQENRYK